MPKVLVVEDDLMIADLVRTLLLGEGYGVCGIARTVADALELCLRCKPEYAIVDLRLADGGIGTEIVSQLGSSTTIGVMYASDNASGTSLTAADGIAFISKPYRSEDLLRSLAIVVDIVTAGRSVLPHPSGFRILRSASTSHRALR